MNPIILPPAMGKIVGQTRFLSLGEATTVEEGKLWIQTCKFRLKIDLVSYPARAEGLVDMFTWFAHLIHQIFDDRPLFKPKTLWLGCCHFK